MDSLARISGQVESAVDGSVHVLLTRADSDGDTLVNVAELGRDGSFVFDTLPGDYLVSAFVDLDGDGAYQASEPAGVNGDASGMPQIVQLSPGERVRLPVLRVLGHEPGAGGFFTKSEVPLTTTNIGRVVDLDEAIFSRDSASLGMWHPVEYVQRFGGGLFFLQSYDPERTPVVFVHGINGTATDFQPALDRLDRDRFQPWVLQYPSGVDLDTISNYFVRALDTLQERHDYGRVIVVAHSMGGVMSRAFVLKATAEPRPWRLALVVTAASPLLGMPSAASGVKHSPIVVPSWRDISPNSVFLDDILEQDWPVEVPYHLVFTFQPGQDDDGVVSLDRQINARLQDEANSVYGVNATHVGVLGDANFLGRLDGWLADADITD